MRFHHSLHALLLALTATLMFAALSARPSLAQHEDESMHTMAQAEHGEADAEHHGREWNLPQLGGMTVNFFLWLAGVVFLAKKMDIKGALLARKTTVVDGMAEAAAIKASAQAKYDEYQARMENMDRELDQIRADMRSAGLAEKERIIQEAEIRADKMREEARFLIEQRVKQLRDELTRDTVAAAIAEAERTVTQGADQDRLVQSYITGLGSSAPSHAKTTINEVSP